LYYIDYNSDTTQVTKVSKTGGTASIAGYNCKSLTVQSPGMTMKYFYAPELYANPEFDKNNKIGRYDAFITESSSLYLREDMETKSYDFSQICTKVQAMPVSDDLFTLPALPQKKLNLPDLVVEPEFTRPGGWPMYVSKAIDKDLILKYLKVPKGESGARQQAMVAFMINEFGRVSNAEVINRKEVHPRLAEEALRVVNESPPWKPATLFGERIIIWYKLPVTFQVK
jgi:hypothetical protein